MRNCAVCGRVSRSNQFRCEHCGTPLRPGLFAAAQKNEQASLRPQPQIAPAVPKNRRDSQLGGPVRIIGQRYRIIKPLGGGGMKRVYLAQDLRLSNRPCALAEMSEDSWNPHEQDAFAQAFAREASILALLKHPRIPHVYDHFSEHNHHFLVMEYVEGETLENRLKASPKGFLDQNFVIHVALQVLEALEYLHGLTPAVIFRDLKPSNLIVSNDGSVKLIDFGIARLFESQKTATMVGTHGYAPPEQYEGKTEPRTDLYALGATMLNLLSGWDPAAHAPFSFPLLGQLRPGCNRALEEIISQALMIDPDQRVPSAQEFTRRLQAIRVADANQSTFRVGATIRQNCSPATVVSGSGPATLSMSGDEATVVLTHQTTCRFCSREIPQDAEACPYCLMAYQRPTGTERARRLLLVGLMFTSLLSIAFGVIVVIQYRNGQARVAGKASVVSEETAYRADARPPGIPKMAADETVSRNEKPLSLREKTLCDRVGKGARLLTLAMGQDGDPRNIKNLSHKLLALLDGTSDKEQNLLRDAFRIVINDIRQNPDWTPEEQADMWRGTCRAERWPATNAQQKLLSPASLTETAAVPTPRGQDFQRSAPRQSAKEDKPAEALKYFCASAMLEQISHMTSQGLNELSRESYRELARELGITQEQARSQFVQMIHYYGGYDGAAQACAARGWLAANP